MSLPATLEDIDAAWLTDVLAARFPAIRVADARIDSKYRGTATVLKLALTYGADNGAPNAPATLYLKTGMEAAHDALWGMGIYQREAFFYANAPAGLGGRPDAYVSLVDEGQRQFAILLEDLGARRARYGSALRPFSPEEVAYGLDRLSEFHAQDISTWDALGGRLPLSMQENRGVFTHHVDCAGELFAALRGHAIPFTLRDPDKVARAFARFEDMLRQQPRTLLHGDPHPGNTYFDGEGRTCFLDFQGLCSGPWMQDVAYFIIGSLDVQDRRDHERDLLRRYCAALQSRTGRAEDFDEVWRHYRMSAFYGFLVWLGNQDDWQLPEINLVGLVRSATAMMDHDSYGLLGV